MLALLNLILISISFYEYQYIIPIIPSNNKFEILTPTLKKKKKLNSLTDHILYKVFKIIQVYHQKT